VIALLRRPGAVVFDLDGTLIDSRADIRTAVNRTRAAFGLPPLSLQAVVGMVGEGARKLLERALADRNPPAEPAFVEAALATYLSQYDAVCLDETRPYPGIPALLEALAERLPLALLSNKGEALSRKILAGLALERPFREILGGDSLPTRKPDPAGLLLLAQRLGISPRDLLLVGDSWIDAATARNAGAAFVLVEWGFPHGTGPEGAARPAGSPPEAIEADLRIARPDELLAALGLS